MSTAVGVSTAPSVPVPVNSSTSVAQSSSPLKNQTKLSLPSSSIFSFKAPLPSSSSSSTSTSGVATPLKQRRVSMALVSSPRVVPESAWSFRDDTGIEMRVAETCLMPEKRGKMRKIAMDGDEESGVKKQRKRWTKEETQMLVDGCNKHGVGNWKTILGDPEFKFDSRSPVDLKDRFRTYFPDAYKQHYPNARTHLSSKVRSTLPDGSSIFEKTRSKKRRPFTEEEDRALKAGYEKHGTVWAAIVKDPIFQEQNRRSTDLRDRFRNAYPDLYQAAGYKPRNASKKKVTAPGESSGSTLAQAKMPVRAATDDQLAMSTTGPHRRKRRNTSQGLLRGGTKSVPQSATPSEDEDSDEDDDLIIRTTRTTRSNSSPLTALPGKFPASISPIKGFTDDDDMGLISMDTDTLSDSFALADFPGNSQSEIDTQSQTWSSGLDTPTHSHNTWAGSPTSSHLSSDYLLSSQSSPFQGRNEGIGMIGKSAWTQDWFSANPRLDSSGSTTSSLLDGGLSPASPFSLHHLNHGVFDRYDLMPATNPHDFSSEIGVGESRSTFSDEMFPPSSGFRGFTHHSDYAGDLIFGARTHQPQASYYGSGFSVDGRQTMGLGLSGMGSSAGINPMQLHTPALPGIDEIQLTGITLDDHHNGGDAPVEDSGIDVDILDLDIHSPKDSHSHQQHHNKHLSHLPQRSQSVMSETRLNLDDLVDMSGEAHITPPGTPLTQSTRQLRKRSLNYGQYSSSHGRSISVPPGEKNPPARPPQIHHASSQPDVLTDRRVFRSNMPSPVTIPNALDTVTPHQPQEQTIIPSPIRHNPPSFSSLFLAQVSQSAQTATNLANAGEASSQAADMNHVPFLDLHYGGMNMMPPPMDESQNYRQALDLAQSLASSVPKVGTPTGFAMSGSGNDMANPTPLSGRRVVSTNGVNAVTGINGIAPNHVTRGRGMASAPPPPPQISSPGRIMPAHGHHRGQSAVNPQDLMLRSDNKRKRASWDGAHILDSC
ncbi:meiotically up-regulated 152 protein [Moniliophthora roreri MCA 2997]|uniref:Meiotically up-regulated 152 protein n=1 Tax=Moniliophthora roreri (strain MCA 2997) TaxID=1381753 RepID=V2XF68_MONRO|nr:meiotically up-regulated 152 protein [Moniliophthora roreri MCA 2997]